MMVKVCIQDGDVVIAFQSIEYLTGPEWPDHSGLAPNAVHVWGIELDGSPRCLERCAQWLDEEEQQRAARLIREEDRRSYVFAHGGLRAVLSRYLGIGPDVVAMYRREAGKPSLVGAVGGRHAITFNMSHAHGRALIAVSKGQEVGVDLERVRADVDVVKLSERYFAPSEHATIMQAIQEQRAARFFRYWVSKEAVVKAQGVGLQALSQCEVLLGADGVGAEIRVPVDSPLQANWRVRLLSCGEGWEAAVAAQGKDWVVQSGFVG
ncbi:MAG: 4'-phosphopantetheinyl transferase superfamily protein [Nitrospirota bacterium]|nr:4'-phosphopantetheinyl transferase superfamily protein [Nitrospirota bacterium]MDP2384499.1 4'-phosphopantetheinyl transferase superfamily protein [Nitrospirota bacterium]